MSGFATVVATLASHWWRRPGQFLALIAGLAAATALWSGVQALNAEARASYDRAAAVLGGDRFETVVMAEGGPMPLARFATLRRAGWDVSPVLDGRWRVGGRSFRLLGVEPLSLPDDALGASEIGEGERLAAFLTPPYPLIAAPETAAELPRSETGADIGEVIEDPAMPPGILIADIARAEELLRRPGEIDRLLVVARGAPLAEITPDLTLRPPEEEGDLARLTDSFHLNLTAFGLLSFVVGLFIVHATVGLAFEQRRATVRTLRAVGVGRAELTLALVVELLVIAAMGAALGMALGYLIAAVLIGDVAASLRGLYGASVPGELSLRPAWWLAGAGMAVAGTFAAAANGVWKLRRMPVLAAAHVEAWHSAERLALRRQGALALALALIAGAALLFGEGLVAGFALMGGVLMAAALALPLALAFLLQVLQARTKGPVGEWIVAEGRAQLGGLSLALMALLLALSVNIGVGAMVSSFRETFLGYLDQRLAADLYLRGKTEAEAADIAALLTARDDVIAVLPIQSVTLERDGYPYDLFGLTDDPMYRENWPLLSAGPDPWGALASGEGIMISEQFSRAQGLALGDRLHPGGTGTAWTPQVVAIFPDYGNPVGQAMTSTSMLTARWPEVELTRFAVRTEPGQGATVLEAVRAAFDLTSDQAIDQAALKAFSRGVFERTFAVTLALNVLTFAVAGLALFTSLLTLAQMRLPHVAPLWALGLTRARLARLEVARAVLLALLTAILAIPLGVLVAWILLAVVNVEAFGWRIPLRHYPAEWAWLVALAAATALVAALWPARALRRTPPALLLKVFSDER